MSRRPGRRPPQDVIFQNILRDNRSVFEHPVKERALAVREAVRGGFPEAWSFGIFPCSGDTGASEAHSHRLSFNLPKIGQAEHAERHAKLVGLVRSHANKEFDVSVPVGAQRGAFVYYSLIVSRKKE